jgi:hypothetical protein
MVLSRYGTEQVGISAEVAVADLSGVSVRAEYRERGRPELVRHISSAIEDLLENLPKPISHIAEEQNPIDFMLLGQKTLSVKSSMRNAGKVAPQNIGQPSSATFWEHLPHFVPTGMDPRTFNRSQSNALFKKIAQERTSELLTEYWNNLFDCDYWLYVHNVLSTDDTLTEKPKAVLYKKSKCPKWDISKFSFTRDLKNWNESCTLKYDSITIGEFQVHNNRDCLKFRFDVGGLLHSGLIKTD